MRKLFWFCCVGAMIVAGVVYLAASSTPKAGVRTLGQKSIAKDDRVSRLHEWTSTWCNEELACQETAPPAMPHIIDVCQPAHHWSIDVSHEHHLIPASAEEPVSIDDAEPIAAPQVEEEDAPEPIGMPSEPEEPNAENYQYPDYPLEQADELHEPMPCLEEEEPKVEVSENPFVSFWLSLFQDAMPPADEETAPEQDADQPMEEIQEEPACQEDPHYSEHYHHCPYMGGRSCPPCPAGGAPKVKKPRGSDDVEECEPCPKAEPDPESPPQPGIDTMEFRPSDAKEGEFESKPM
jgi:hypothetical protein